MTTDEIQAQISSLWNQNKFIDKATAFKLYPLYKHLFMVSAEEDVYHISGFTIVCYYLGRYDEGARALKTVLTRYLTEEVDSRISSEIKTICNIKNFFKVEQNISLLKVLATINNDRIRRPSAFWLAGLLADQLQQFKLLEYYSILDNDSMDTLPDHSIFQYTRGLYAWLDGLFADAIWYFDDTFKTLELTADEIKDQLEKNFPMIARYRDLIDKLLETPGPIRIADFNLLWKEKSLYMLTAYLEGVIHHNPSLEAEMLLEAMMPDRILGKITYAQRGASMPCLQKGILREITERLVDLIDHNAQVAKAFQSPLSNLYRLKQQFLENTSIVKQLKKAAPNTGLARLADFLGINKTPRIVYGGNLEAKVNFFQYVPACTDTQTEDLTSWLNNSL